MYSLCDYSWRLHISTNSCGIINICIIIYSALSNFSCRTRFDLWTTEYSIKNHTSQTSKWEKGGIEDPSGNIQKIHPPISTSEGASQWGSPRKTQRGEPRKTGGNIIYYLGYVITLTLDLTTMKLHVNSAISDFKVRYMCMNVKDFYPNNMMDRSEYIIIHIEMILQEFVENTISKKNYTADTSIQW